MSASYSVRINAILLSLMLAAAGTTSGRAARAETAPAQSAIELGRRGLESFSRGSFELAKAQFSAAEELAHSPVFLLYMARCDRALGKWTAARDSLRRVVAEELDAQAPAPWQHAVASAHAELGLLSTELPSLWLELPAASAIAGLTIDGKPVAFAVRQFELEVDPGPHELVLTHADGTKTKGTVHARQGVRRTRVEWQAASINHGAPELARSAPEASSSSSTRGRDRQLLGYVALGGSAAALVLGVTSGIVALGIANDVRSGCTDEGLCPREDAARAEQATDWGNLSTLSFIAEIGRAHV